ncbi:MAG: hypothetical protein IPF66_06810 [Holophagales bacterium]|nr:hypothetical protein [Holophagales bacterium]
MAKPRIATTSLAGCFGCHMSILDLDERILELAEIVEFRQVADRRPEAHHRAMRGRPHRGRCANDENVHVLRAFRRNCDVLVSVGDCATMGGIPALRKPGRLDECLRRPTWTARRYTTRAPNPRRRRDPAPSREGLPRPTRSSGSTTTCRVAPRPPTRSGAAPRPCSEEGRRRWATGFQVRLRAEAGRWGERRRAGS